MAPLDDRTTVNAMTRPRAVWYASAFGLALAWLATLVGVTVADWDGSWALALLSVAGLLVGALRHRRWTGRAKAEPTSAEEALKGYPSWW